MVCNYFDFFNEFENAYESLKRSSSDLLTLSPQMIRLIEKKLKTLNNWLTTYEFDSIQDEIHFFKELKPSLVSKLIFYQTTLKITSSLPPAKKDKKKHYQKALAKIYAYTLNNKGFYEYYRSKSTFKDADYFTRHDQIDLLHEDCWVINNDVRYCTSYEYKTALIIANDMLTHYLETALDELNGVRSSHALNDISTLNWSCSKVDFAEHVYSLVHSGVINAGKVEVKELAFHLGRLFNVKIDDSIYRIYADIKARKNIRTKFLHTLIENFNRKLDEEDA